MTWLLLLTLAGNTQSVAGPFETREMCESHKIELLLNVSKDQYGYYVSKLACVAGNEQVRR